MLILFISTSFSQSKKYVNIYHNDVKYTKMGIFDTLSVKNKEKWEFWKKTKRFDLINKIRIENQNINKNIAKDSSSTTEILFTGETDLIRIEYKGIIILKKELKTPIKKNSYMSFLNENNILLEKYYHTYKIGEIPRSKKIITVKLFFEDKKRIAEIKLDTNYSRIEIVADNIYNKKNLNSKNVNQSKTPPETIEIIAEELIINHIIPVKENK